MIVSDEGAAELHLRGSIGDRVRAGEDNARGLERTLADCNKRSTAEGIPFEFVREGDTVFLEGRFTRSELSDEQQFLLMREFESALMNVPPEIEAHMEAVHDEDDDDCVCSSCLAADALSGGA